MEPDTKLNAEYGFRQLDPLPNPKALAEYYAKHYYTRAPLNLTNEELKYIRLEAKLTVHTLKNHLSEMTLLDLGCGPGFYASEFRAMNWKVILCDYAIDPIEKYNPQLKDSFTECDIERYVKGATLLRGLINLQNVLEHVYEPVEFLKNMKLVMSKGSVLRIKVPNDFSKFQELLFQSGLTTKTWVHAPDHISYFNYTSLRKTLTKLGFKIISLQADFPVEIFLINRHSNYSITPEHGPEAHKARIKISNYLLDQSLSRYKKYAELAARLDFGRQLTAYVKAI